MTRDQKPRGAYAQGVFDETQRYIQKLLDSNDQLRRKLAGLASEKASLEQDHLRSREEILTLREELTRCREAHTELQSRLQEVEGESRSYADEYLRLERRNSDLMHLYVASYGLHGTVDRSAILQSIKEIVINLIGSEELAILELGDNGGFQVADSFGVEEAVCRSLSKSHGLVGQVVATGGSWIEGQSPGGARTEAEEDLTACLPLVVGERVFGVLVIFRLLPQKTGGLVEVDFELLDLLAEQAGTALYCSTLYDLQEQTGDRR